MGRLHDGSGNSHRGAVAPFLDHRPHIVITPCIYIAATFCQEFRSCVNNVDTVRELCKNPTFSVHWGYLLSESRFPDLLETLVLKSFQWNCWRRVSCFASRGSPVRSRSRPPTLPFERKQIPRFVGNVSAQKFPVELLEASFVLCKQGVTGSIPVTSTNFLFCLYRVSCLCATAFESA